MGISMEEAMGIAMAVFKMACAAPWQMVVAAYILSKQLLLFAFCHCRIKNIE